MGMAFYYAPFGEIQWRCPLGLALGQYALMNGYRMQMLRLGTVL